MVALALGPAARAGMRGSNLANGQKIRDAVNLAQGVIQPGPATRFGS
ncbi:MAG: hypothetical protein ACI9W2_001777, partial [Gammaproteobacteria bacterium]